MKITLNYKLVKNFQTVEMSCELEDPSDEDIENYKTYLKDTVIGELEDVCARVQPTDQNKPNNPQSKPQFNKGNTGYHQNYNRSQNGYNQPQIACSDKQRLILQRAGFSDNKIDNMTKEEVSATIKAIFSGEQ